MLIQKQFNKQNSLDNPGDAVLGNESMFVLTILEEIKETRLKVSQGSVTVLWKMANYQEARVKLTNTQLKKLKSAAKNKTGAISRLNKKTFEDE